MIAAPPLVVAVALGAHLVGALAAAWAGLRLGEHGVSVAGDGGRS